MSQENWTPIYSICPDTGLRVCEILQFLLIREDGMVRNIHRFQKEKKSRKKWHFGNFDGHGYRQVRSPRSISNNFKSKCFFTHRLLAMAFIENPYKKTIVDHIDGDITNNSIDNLRWCTKRENQQNLKLHRNGKLCGTRMFETQNGVRWASNIEIKGKSIYIGAFDTELEAHQAYIQKAKEVDFDY